MIRQDFIRAWIKRHETRCFYCGTEFGARDTLLAPSIEHVYPKHRYPGLELNEVKACRGCNFAKNGFMPDEFRDYLTGGEDFYCERILGERIPRVVETLRNALHGMVDRHFKDEIKEIHNAKSGRQYQLTLRLRQIMREMRDKNLTFRENYSSLNRAKEA